MCKAMNESDLPASKHDHAAAERIVAAGMPAIEPILPGILKWFQDYNWPVARSLEPVIRGMGKEVVPHVKRILASEDEVWKYWMIVVVIPQLSADARAALREDVARIAERPTKVEVTEEVAEVAAEYLRDMRTT
jgi:hypothetical protein